MAWGDEVEGLRSEPVLSEEAAVFLVHLVVLCVLARRVFLGGFWGVVSPRRSSAAGIESRDDDDDVNSEREALAALSEATETLACVWWCGGGTAVRGGGSAVTKPALFVSEWEASGARWIVLWAPGSMSIDGATASGRHRDVGRHWAESSPSPPIDMA